ncbi:TPA: hypothetical protein DIC40_06480 [Patescibacteria group bacterium]|nr:hypothetical protein [Candidatus Gracilibacteria bacterium]
MINSCIIGFTQLLIYSDCSSIPLILSTPNPAVIQIAGIIPPIRVRFGPNDTFLAEEASRVFLFLLVIHFSAQPPILATGINPFTSPKDAPVYIAVFSSKLKFLFRARCTPRTEGVSPTKPVPTLMLSP